MQQHKTTKGVVALQKKLDPIIHQHILHKFMTNTMRVISSGYYGTIVNVSPSEANLIQNGKGHY